MQKIWQKYSGQKINAQIEAYTIGNDYLLDEQILPYDIKASVAHARMLKKIGILSAKELKKLECGLYEILALFRTGKFKIDQSQEDCHTALEAFLTEKYGEVGKKIHTGRSRNDQILVAMRLFSKDKIKEIERLVLALIKTFKAQAKRYKNTKMPGYTHMQRAMPSSVLMWLDSFSESLRDDLELLDEVFEIIDCNPFGSASGYGESVLGLDREFTTKELGFSRVQKNPMYCAFSRGKFENMILQAGAQIMLDIGKFASDLLLFTTKEFDFFSLPDEFLTGSSIMPQKKNYDVLELIRANVSVFLGCQFTILSIIKNLPSGYNRDFQLTKEPYLKALKLLLDTIEIANLIVSNLKIHKKRLENACTSELYATDEVYKLVKRGISFREAYRKVGQKFTK